MCYDQVWSTLESDSSLTISELLDICDMQFVFLHLGIFGKLKLKWRHGHLPPLKVEHSPPEFPAWTNNPSKEVTNITYMLNLEGFMDNELLNQYLNIKQESNDIIATYQPLTGTNTDDSMNQSSMALTGTNITNISEDLVVDNIESSVLNTDLGIHPDNAEDQDIATTTNPITLKENYVQAMLSNCKVSSPATLFYICTDYITWNPNVTYCCSMVLPCSMNTTRQVAVLQRICYVVETQSKNICQVTLYDNVKINTTVKEYWFEQASEHNYQVQLHQLTPTEIQHWTKPNIVTLWKDLDPYSSLEDIGDTSGDNQDTVTSESETALNPANIRSRLHTCKPVRASSG